MKNIYFACLALFALATFSCTKDKKNSGSTVVAVTPAPLPAAGNACSNYAYRNGFYYDANNNVVTCTNGDPNSCSNFRFDASRGFYLDTAGNRVECNFNSLFNNNNGIFPYNTNTGNGCGAYSQGVFYPVLMGGTIVCVNRITLEATFTQAYLNRLYYGGAWAPGNPILASCQMGTSNCKCNSVFWGTLQWCWAQF